MGVAKIISKNGVQIRLTEERWEHICLMHPSLTNKKSKVLATVKNPDYILKGKARELLAVSMLSKRAYLVVVYKEILLSDESKELSSDGFIITAFETTDILWLFKKKIIWNKPS